MYVVSMFVFTVMLTKTCEKKSKKKTHSARAASTATPGGEAGKATRACAESRAVSLQKGTNQPATRMSLNRSQRSCRSTKYGTQAKT